MAVLVAAEPVLDTGAIERLARETDCTTRWLSPARALELHPRRPGEDRLHELEPLVRAMDRVDHFVLPLAGRRKHVLLSDMDSTIITIECIDELADMIGIKAEVAAVTEAAMAGSIDFEAALRQRVALLEGTPATAIDTVLKDRLRLMPGAVRLVRTMRAHGHRSVLVSGGFTAFADHVRERVGFDRAHANELEIRDGRLTGRLLGPIVGPAAKLDHLHALALEVGRAAILAVGDGANDRPMIEAAGLGAAFRAKPVLEAAADIVVRHTGLDSLLYVQGYADDGMVDGS